MSNFKRLKTRDKFYYMENTAEQIFQHFKTQSRATISAARKNNYGWENVEQGYQLWYRWRLENHNGSFSYVNATIEEIIERLKNKQCRLADIEQAITRAIIRKDSDNIDKFVEAQNLYLAWVCKNNHDVVNARVIKLLEAKP